MATIQENLQKIINSKAAIKNSINAKGGTITDSTPLDEYSTAIDNLPGGASSPYIELIENPTFSYTTAGVFSLISKVTLPQISASAFIQNCKAWCGCGNDGPQYGYTKVTSLDLSNLTGNITTIPENFFRENRITEIIGDFSHITTIGNCAFMNGSSIDIITYLTDNCNLSFSNITFVGREAFARYNHDFTFIAPNCTSIGGGFKYYISFTESYLTEAYLNISEWGNAGEFSLCSKLNKLTFGSNLTNISFSGIMGYYTSSSPSTLTTLVFKSTIPPTVSSGTAFDPAAFPALAHIYVPAASVSAYQTATNWSQYASIISADPNE